MPGDVAASEWRQIRVGDTGNDSLHDRRRSTSGASSGGRVGGDERSVVVGGGGGLQVRNLSTGDVDVVVPGSARRRASTEGDALLVGGRKVSLPVCVCLPFCVELRGFIVPSDT